MKKTGSNEFVEFLQSLDLKVDPSLLLVLFPPIIALCDLIFHNWKESYSLLVDKFLFVNVRITISQGLLQLPCSDSQKKKLLDQSPPIWRLEQFPIVPSFDYIKRKPKFSTYVCYLCAFNDTLFHIPCWLSLTPQSDLSSTQYQQIYILYALYYVKSCRLYHIFCKRIFLLK